MAGSVRASALIVATVGSLVAVGFTTFRPDANQLMRRTASRIDSAGFFLLNDVPAEAVLS